MSATLRSQVGLSTGSFCLPCHRDCATQAVVTDQHFNRQNTQNDVRLRCHPALHYGRCLASCCVGPPYASSGLRGFENAAGIRGGVCLAP